MGIISKWRKRCTFCKSKAGPLEYVPDFGIYGEVCAGDWYHKDCLIDVACNPETYGHRTADKALHIYERIQKTAHRKREKKEKYERLCSALKEHCIEDE